MSAREAIPTTIGSAARIGDLVVACGISGADATGNLSGTPEEQFARAFGNLRTTVDRAGLTLDNVAHVTAFIPGLDYRPYINPPWLETFGDQRPARKTTHTSLPEGVCVELQAIAVDGGRRQALEIPGLRHRDPLPMGTRMGDLVFSSVLGGEDPATGQPRQGREQIEQAFSNMRRLVEIAGGSPDDIALVWVFLGDFSFQAAMVEIWLKMFPQDGNRPARKTFGYDMSGRGLAQLQMIAGLGAGRENFEIPGIGHHDPIPLGARVGRLFFSSGVDGRDPATGRFEGRAAVSVPPAADDAAAPGGGPRAFRANAGAVRAQASQALRNVRTLMELAGGSLEQVLQATVLLGDPSYRSGAMEAWSEMFPPVNRPALQALNIGTTGREVLVQFHVMGVLGPSSKRV